MKGSVVALIFCLALFGAVLVPNASANSGNEEMILTIKKAPVELPGHVLVPGKYDLKFTNLEHNEVVVRTADGSQPVGFFMVIPVTRNRVTNNPKLDIAEPSKGSIARLDEFFYPDLKTGYEFIYAHPQVTAQAATPHS
jgi:hypothetical protein